MKYSRAQVRFLLVAIVVTQGTLFASIRSSGRQALSLDELSKRALPLMVSLTGEDADGQAIAAGSGFVFGRGMIVTDFRVIKDAFRIRARRGAGEEALDAVLVAVDERFAVAALRISAPGAGPDEQKTSMREQSDVVSFRIAPVHDAAVAEDVYVVSSLGSGETSALPSSVDEHREIAGVRYLHLTGALTPQFAGGPVLNAQGALIGMVVATPNEGAGPCFAIPVGSIGGCGLEGFGANPDVAKSRVGAQEQLREPGGVPGGLPGKPGEAATSGAETRDGSSLQIIRKAGGVLQGSAIRRVQPLYPPLAKAAKVSGSVVVEVVVDETGDVTMARAVSGHPLMKDCAVAAARGWKFRPTELSGKPVKVIGTITFNFTLY